MNNWKQQDPLSPFDILRVIPMLILSIIILSGCGDTKPGPESEKTLMTWATGQLKVSMEIDATPLHVGEYQNFTLIITTSGTEPVINFSDFARGGFSLKEWNESPPLAVDENQTYKYRGRLEPLRSGELLIPPIRILSGGIISEEIITEGIPVSIPSMLTREESEAVAEGTPRIREPERTPAPGPDMLIILPLVIGTAGIIFLLVYLYKKRKKEKTEKTPSERALYKTESLNPENYTDFYTRAAEIIREFGAKDEKLLEILNYYELAAYSGRLKEFCPAEEGTLPGRFPGKDKAVMMVFFAGGAVE